jgi:hypothetical protein
MKVWGEVIMGRAGMDTLPYNCVVITLLAFDKADRLLALSEDLRDHEHQDAGGVLCDPGVLRPAGLGN